MKSLMISVIMLFVTALCKVEAGTKLMIDHDGGADDAMGLFIAMLYEKYFNGPPVIALTTTHGNVGEQQTFDNTQWILDIAQRRDIPVYRGAKSALVQGHRSDYFFGLDGLGDIRNSSAPYKALQAQPLHAALALIQNSITYRGELVVVCIGSLTNIALAIKLDPHFMSRLARLYIGASTVYGPKYLTPEFNVQMDVEAYSIVVRHSKPDKVTLVPFSSVFDSFNISTNWRYNVLGAIPTTIMKTQNQFETVLRSHNYTSWFILDPVTVALIEDSNLITESDYSRNDVILCGKQRGINTNNFTVTPDKANVKIVMKQNQTEYQNFLYNVFSAELGKSNIKQLSSDYST